MTNVATITPRFRGEPQEEIRGYDELSYQTPGIAVFLWYEKQESVAIPLDCVKCIVTRVEEDSNEESI